MPTGLKAEQEAGAGLRQGSVAVLWLGGNEDLIPWRSNNLKTN